MLLNEIVKLPKLDEIIKEFEEDVANYKSRYPNFTHDIEQLKNTLELFKAGKYKEAYKIINMADTIVRDVVPIAAWEILDSRR